MIYSVLFIKTNLGYFFCQTKQFFFKLIFFLQFFGFTDEEIKASSERSNELAANDLEIVENPSTVEDVEKAASQVGAHFLPMRIQSILQGLHFALLLFLLRIWLLSVSQSIEVPGRPGFFRNNFEFFERFCFSNFSKNGP
jgi:hypothetical protein